MRHRCDWLDVAVVEAELLGAVCEVLARLGFQDFVVRLNHRRLLSALLEQAGLPPAQHGDALVAIDKLDKIGRDGDGGHGRPRDRCGDRGARCLDAFVRPPADVTMPIVLRRLRASLPADGDGAGVAEVRGDARLCEATPAAGRIRLDLGLARGLSYYTGAIMEIAVPDLAGSLGGGGRYDN